MPVHPDQPNEQDFVDRAYARIETLRTEASELLAEAYSGRGTGTPQGLMERDVFVDSLLRRLEQLSVGNESLCFGRLDFEDDEFRIGRMAVSDVNQEIMVVDWRAPIAEPFYRATGKDPMGLRRRRHYLTNGRKVLDLEDELFGDQIDEMGGLVGGSVLSATLERGRSGHMRDIVATIQFEQDEIIRASLTGALIVQGGPGTGKTAVALHRAAYLLYTHRFPLETQGVLLVGPNPVFLRYISHVLPSLGESGVETSTIMGLASKPNSLPLIRERLEVARVKGSPIMSDVIRKAIRDRERPLRKDAFVPFGASQLRLSVEATSHIVKSANRRQGTHNGKRRMVENAVCRALYDELTQTIERGIRLGFRASSEDGQLSDVPRPISIEYDDFAAQVRTDKTVIKVLDRIWPWLYPEELLHDLYGSEPLLRLAAKDLLGDQQTRLLYRTRSASFEEVQWTDSDIPLLDEANAGLGPVKPKKGEHDSLRTFGHIVVDEAQDLSPMQLRMIGRRSLNGSLTIVGDIAQATGPASTREWGEILAHLTPHGGQRIQPTFVELSVSYRTPSEILDLAAKVLKVSDPNLKAPNAVRDSGVKPLIVRVEENSNHDVSTGSVDTSGSSGSVMAEIVRATRLLREELTDGNVAVICAPSWVERVEMALRRGDIQIADANDSLECDVVVVPTNVMKGLEFDGVVVVEPAAIVEEADSGLRSLYVALTRSTRRLSIVHQADLPLAMR